MACQVVVINTVRAAWRKVVCRWFPCGSSQKRFSWHQGPQTQTSNGSGPQRGARPLPVCRCLRMCAHVSPRVRASASKQNKDRWRKRIIEAGKKDERRRQSVQKQTRTMMERDQGELFTSRRTWLLWKFQECCVWDVASLRSIRSFDWNDRGIHCDL